MVGWVKPSFPSGSMPVILGVLGAVVMPHNLFLHSEIIQSRQWNLEDSSVIEQQLKYEFKDTLFSMIIGWAINSAMILMAAATLYQNGSGKQVDDLTVAGKDAVAFVGECGNGGLRTGTFAGGYLIQYHCRNGRWNDIFRNL